MVSWIWSPATVNGSYLQVELPALVWELPENLEVDSVEGRVWGTKGTSSAYKRKSFHVYSKHFSPPHPQISWNSRVPLCLSLCIYKIKGHKLEIPQVSNTLSSKRNQVPCGKSHGSGKWNACSNILPQWNQQPKKLPSVFVSVLLIPEWDSEMVTCQSPHIRSCLNCTESGCTELRSSWLMVMHSSSLFYNTLAWIADLKQGHLFPSVKWGGGLDAAWI